MTDWQQQNLADLHERLQWLHDKPDGFLYEQKTDLQHVVVWKQDGQILLYFVENGEASKEPKPSGVMSRLQLDDPLHLPSGYAQAIFLSLIWKPDPSHVHVVGFSGGRLPQVLHHFFPGVIVESTEIDPVCLELAQQYFGIVCDERLQVHIEDGRAFLEKHEEQYDIIIIDAFTDDCSNPEHLTSTEFYALCKSRLTDGGCVAINWVNSDPDFPEKLEALKSSFAHVYRCRHAGANVMIASDTPKTYEQIREGGRQLDAQYHFPFMLSERARDLEEM